METGGMLRVQAGPGSGRGDKKPRCKNVCAHRKGGVMLQYAVIFFIIAIIAAVFGFGGIAAGAAAIAKILFYIFLVVFLVTLLLGVVRR
jgi:uncharacterized membrane protein YtjA (UPF0391 family)